MRGGCGVGSLLTRSALPGASVAPGGNVGLGSGDALAPTELPAGPQNLDFAG
ncbi:MAG: hypothetical protein KTR15_01700 [Phycisphaeraceae bacterium]|nr:hypothetical protein [Phycisphaeraceae bacterium]